MTKVLVPLAEGCEEMEAVIIIDVLRRAGWEVTAAGVTGETVTCSRGVKLVADARWEDVDVDAYDLLVLPGGGPGTEVLRNDDRVLDALRRFHGDGKIVAAVCAGPLALQAAGILDGRTATCHPGVAQDLTRANRVDDRVVWDGTVATSQGPGTSFEFALSLVARIDGEAKAAELARAMVLPGK